MIAFLALFVSLGGTGYAAVSITGQQVRDGSLTGADVKNSSLTGTDVKDRSLKRADFAAGQLPAGARGSTGSAGSAGPAGPAGPAGAPASDASFTGAAAGGDLQGTFPNPTLKADAVSAADVANGSLRLADLGITNGTSEYNPAPIAAGACSSAGIGSPVTQSDVVVASAVDLLNGLYVVGGVVPSTTDYLIIKICNATASTIDPPLMRVNYVVLKG